LTQRTYATEVWLPRPVEELFVFFSDASNLDRITPPWLRFRILTPTPVRLRQGSLLDYRLRWRGLPLRWQTEITVWEPPVRFVDTQRQGPYRQWIHEHRFEAHQGGTWMADRVDYAIPGGYLEPALHGFLVGPDVRRIFEYRRRVLLELFGNGREPDSRNPPQP
jgi:ligand-binding SRPBCC domain-containing protein